jgi:hypothetical protein
LNPSLGAQVTEGRRREFAHFPEFSNEQVRCSIPDPQAASTFEASRLHWDERARPEHSGVLELYRALIALRLDHPSALGASTDTAGDALVIDDETLALRRTDGDNEVFWVVTRFRGGGEVDLAAAIDAREDGSPSWSVVLTTEDPVFAADPRPPVIDEQRGPRIRFARAGAVILRKHPRRQTV